ncbi:DUF6308 family protein [Streptomyces sp. NPDC057543]
MARKRPRLLPVYDRVVRCAVRPTGVVLARPVCRPVCR